jgi:hypothetical protein
MGQWLRSVDEHPVWGALKTFGPILDQAKAIDNPDPDAAEGLDRIHAILELVGKRLAATDPFLLRGSSLNHIEKGFREALAQLQSYLSNSAVPHIVAANAQLDEDALAVLPLIPAIEGHEDLTIVNESLTRFRKSIGQYMAETEAERQNLEATIERNSQTVLELEAKIAADKEQLSSISREFQSQFSTGEDARRSEFTTAQNDRQTKFTEFQIASQTKVAEVVQEYGDTLKSRDEQHIKEVSELHKWYKVEAEKTVAGIEEHKVYVEDLVGVIGGLGVAAGYQKVAKRDYIALIAWQAITVLSLIGLICSAIEVAFPYTLIDPPSVRLQVAAPSTPPSPVVESVVAKDHKKLQKSSSGSQTTSSPTEQVVAAVATNETAPFFEGFVKRLFLSVAFGIFAAYAARQAKHCMESERTNRKIALEQQALNPYIAPLPVEEQHKFRILVGERSFAAENRTLPVKDDDDLVTFLDALNPKYWKTLLELLKAKVGN